MSKLAFGTILVAIAAMELVYILTVTDDDGEVLFYPVTVVAAIVNLVRNWNCSLKLVKNIVKNLSPQISYVVVFGWHLLCLRRAFVFSSKW